VDDSYQLYWDRVVLQSFDHERYAPTDIVSLCKHPETEA